MALKTTMQGAHISLFTFFVSILNPVILYFLEQIELKSLKEAVEMEKDVWMNNYKKLQANKLLEREADLRHQYKRERDRDIEIAIERLETEATKVGKVIF